MHDLDRKLSNGRGQKVELAVHFARRSWPGMGHIARLFFPTPWGTVEATGALWGALRSGLISRQQRRPPDRRISPMAGSRRAWAAPVVVLIITVLASLLTSATANLLDQNGGWVAIRDGDEQVDLPTRRRRAARPSTTSQGRQHTYEHLACRGAAPAARCEAAKMRRPAACREEAATPT